MSLIVENISDLNHMTMVIFISELTTCRKRICSATYVSLYECKTQIFNKAAHQPSIQGGSNMTGTDLCVNKPHCAAAVRP